MHDTDDVLVTPNANSKTERKAEDFVGDDIISVRYNVAGQEPEHVIAPKAATKVVSFYLLAEKNKPYQGYELLQALLGAGLRFGKQQIFHYTPKQENSGAGLFSCASIEQPGTFDIQHMGGCTCKGLVLFFTATAGATNSLESFEAMLDSLHSLHEALGGDVYDQSGMTVTENMLQDVRNFIVNPTATTATAE